MEMLWLYVLCFVVAYTLFARDEYHPRWTKLGKILSVVACTRIYAHIGDLKLFADAFDQIRYFPDKVDRCRACDLVDDDRTRACIVEAHCFDLVAMALS